MFFSSRWISSKLEKKKPLINDRRKKMFNAHLIVNLQQNRWRLLSVEEKKCFLIVVEHSNVFSALGLFLVDISSWETFLIESNRRKADREEKICLSSGFFHRASTEHKFSVFLLFLHLINSKAISVFWYFWNQTQDIDISSRYDSRWVEQNNRHFFLKISL